MDDTAMWDPDMEPHWWRMADFLELLGHNGIVFNEKKFQFVQKEVEFEDIAETGIRPLEKFLIAIQDFHPHG